MVNSGGGGIDGGASNRLPTSYLDAVARFDVSQFVTRLIIHSPLLKHIPLPDGNKNK